MRSSQMSIAVSLLALLCCADKQNPAAPDPSLETLNATVRVYARASREPLHEETVHLLKAPFVNFSAVSRHYYNMDEVESVSVENLTWVGERDFNRLYLSVFYSGTSFQSTNFLTSWSTECGTAPPDTMTLLAYVIDAEYTHCPVITVKWVGAGEGATFSDTLTVAAGAEAVPLNWDSPVTLPGLPDAVKTSRHFYELLLPQAWCDPSGSGRLTQPVLVVEEHVHGLNTWKRLRIYFQSRIVLSLCWEEMVSLHIMPVAGLEDLM